MNSLDRAFIRAYARDLDIDSVTAAAASRSAAAAPPRRRAESANHAPNAPEPMVQVSYTDGGWYRIEQHDPSPAVVPAPHTRYENAPRTQPSPCDDASASDDIDLMARFRPPMFRAVTFRTHAQAVAAKAEAIAARAESFLPAANANAGPCAAVESFDYTLAPPSPPLAPRISVTEYAPHESPLAAESLGMPALARLAPQTPLQTAAPSTGLSEAEIEQYASDCAHLRSVVLELTGDENLSSPDDAHVMVVDMPLELLEDDQDREQKRLEEEEFTRRRQAMLAALMLQEVISNDAPCEPQWLYGSEESANCESSCHADLTETITEAHAAGHTPADEPCPGACAMEPLADEPQLLLEPQTLLPVTPACDAEIDSEAETAGEELSDMPPQASALHEPCPATREEPLEVTPLPDAITEPPSAAPIAPLASSPEPEPVVPAWEVDRIVWPLICDQLLDDAGAQFQSAIDRFRQTASNCPVVVTGHERGEGRTTLAICLARAAAAAGLRVAIVDADFDSPQIAPCLSLDTISGWDGVLHRGADLNEAAITSIDDRLTVVPLEKALSPATLDSNHTRLEEALSRLVATYDLVLLDAAPSTELLAEGSWLRKLAVKPHLLLAHDMRSASLIEVQQTIELAQVAGFEVVGIAQTFAPDQE